MNLKLNCRTGNIATPEFVGEEYLQSKFILPYKLFCLTQTHVFLLQTRLFYAIIKKNREVRYERDDCHDQARVGALPDGV